MIIDSHFWIALAGIVWIDLLLSGDNAVVVAMVCRTMPKGRQRVGIAFGTTAAIGLRVIMAFCVSTLMAIEGLRIVGGLFLLYVAAKLIWNQADAENERPPATTLISAVITIAIADASMSLDNVMAIAALAKGNIWLMAFGVLLSIPLVIAGATMIKSAIDRFPWIVWLGAGLLGWVAGDIIVGDPLIESTVKAMPTISIATEMACAATGAALVIGVGVLQRVGRGPSRNKSVGAIT